MEDNLGLGLNAWAGSDIEKSFTNNDLEKAGKPIGTISTYKDGSKWKKVGPDKWEPVKEGGSSSKPSSGDNKTTPPKNEDSSKSPKGVTEGIEDGKVTKEKKSISTLELEVGLFSARETAEGKAFMRASADLDRAESVLKTHGISLPGAKSNYDAAQNRLSKTVAPYKEKLLKMAEKRNS